MSYMTIKQKYSLTKQGPFSESAPSKELPPGPPANSQHIQYPLLTTRYNHHSARLPMAHYEGLFSTRRTSKKCLSDIHYAHESH